MKLLIVYIQRFFENVNSFFECSKTMQEHTVNAPNDNGLFGVKYQVAIGTTVIAKEPLEWNGDLAVCKTLSLTPSAVFGNAAAFFLGKARHDGDSCWNDESPVFAGARIFIRGGESCCENISNISILFTNEKAKRRQGSNHCAATKKPPGRVVFCRKSAYSISLMFFTA